MTVDNYIITVYNGFVTDQNSRFSLDDLCVLADLPKRTVRYYVQEGLVSRPEGETRAATYSHQHLEQLLTIKKWQQAGVSLERIRELLEGRDDGLALPPPRPRRPGSVKVWSHIMLGPGVEVTIDPEQAALSPEQIRALARKVLEAFESIKQENNK